MMYAHIIIYYKFIYFLIQCYHTISILYNNLILVKINKM